MTPTHIAGVTRHARQRAIERLGYDPMPHEWLAAVASIQARSALLVAAMTPHTNGCERWAVALGVTRAVATWNVASSVIVTVQTLAMGAVNATRLRAREAQRKPRGAEPYRRARGRIDAEAGE
jgi:hypothetical protein